MRSTLKDAGDTVSFVGVCMTVTDTELVAIKPPLVTVTVMTYEPAAVKVAVVVGLLYPLKLMFAGPVLDHVYPKYDAPAADAETLKLVVVPVTVLGLAESGVIMLGTLGGITTATNCCPLTVPLVAVTL